MKHNMKKIISLVLVLAMTLALSVPGFAAEKDNRFSSETQVNITAGGREVHGAWWGPKETINVSGITDALGLATAIGTALAGTPWPVATALGVAISKLKSDANYLVCQNYYEEIYMNGEFAYFRTTEYVHAYYDSACTLEVPGSPCIKVFEGNAPAVIRD